MMSNRLSSPVTDNAAALRGTGSAGPLADRLYQRLRALAADATQGSPPWEKYLSLTLEFTGAAYAACWAWNNDRFVLLASQGKLPAQVRTAGYPDLTRACQRAMQGVQLVHEPLPGCLASSVVAVPILDGEQTAPWVLLAICPTDNGVSSFRPVLLERIAAAIEGARRIASLQGIDWELRATSAALELLSGVARAPSLQQAYHYLVNELQQCTDAHHVALGLVSPATATCRLVAISSTAEFDRSSPLAAQLTSAMDECLVRPSATLWPPLQTNERFATRAHRRLAECLHQPTVCSLPLRVAPEQPNLGVLLFAGPRESIQSQPMQSLLRALAPHIATALELRQRAQPSWWSATWAWLWGGREASAAQSALPCRRALLAILGLCVLAAPWLPMPHRIATTCEVEPVVRRFAVAPYGGLLKSSLATTGDVVQKGQVLAQMDDRELRWELSATLAELDRVRTKRHQAMNEHEVAEAQLAELEMEQMELKARLLQQRAAQMEIVSPLSGVVLTAPYEHTESAPVKIGQTLFEIAPLHPIHLVLSIPEMDLPSVRVGLPVTARLDGARGRPVSATVTRIHPGAQLHQERHVFLAEVELDNPEQLLRPGMHGRARISAGYRTLGWIWFHKAWHRLQLALGV